MSNEPAKVYNPFNAAQPLQLFVEGFTPPNPNQNQVGRPVHCPPRPELTACYPASTDQRPVAALVGAWKVRFKPRCQICLTGPARSGLRALPYSLRLWCEGLEEKFLERGAPAPLLFRLQGRLPCQPEFGAGRTALGSWLGRRVAFQRGICRAVRTALLWR